MQSFESRDPSQLPWIGPVPGDIAEIEGYCRIFRAAESLHTALMDTLCNPLTGECRVSYEMPSEEKPQLEDKIVSVLGCIVSLLNEGRQDVLSGRPSEVKNTFHVTDVSITEERLPPLAIFRSEMKRCCESLHIALQNYLPLDDDRSLHVWRKLQRLKNVCYDSGFPRGEDYPGHTLFANWSPVYLSTSKDGTRSTNSDVAFCKGGQVTEEGLDWLLNKGYRTVIDLRAEKVKDDFYEAALNNAVASGTIELVNIPVEVGTAPSMEQVVLFASYVLDCSKRPIYLHSKEGVWRTSAMISRWRQFMARPTAHLVSNSLSSSDDMILGNSKGLKELQDSSISAKRSLLEKELESLLERSDVVHGSDGLCLKNGSVENNVIDKKTNGSLNGSIHDQEVPPSDAAIDEVESLATFCRETNPLKAQIPPQNIFCKKEMSSFLKTRKIAPPSFYNYKVKRIALSPSPRNMSIATPQGTVLSDGRSNDLHMGMVSRSSNGAINGKHHSADQQELVEGNGKPQTVNSSTFVVPTVNKLKRYPNTDNEIHKLTNHYNVQQTANAKSQIIERTRKGVVVADDGIGPIGGDMCASATGVVRVQSRKKAEMFLVRTDGFSCNREKVTETSLAFTHPSTQQQMLMWKSTPRTVLLLKKLGQELMEEAKEVCLLESVL